MVKKNIDGDLFGVDLFGDAVVPVSRGILADRFLFPPFSVLNAREGAWQNRKRAWIGLGIKSEVGRGGDNREGICFNSGDSGDLGDLAREYAARKSTPGGGGPNLIMQKQPGDAGFASFNKTESSKKYGINSHLSEKEQKALGCFAECGETTTARAGGSTTGTSIFDPVICELLYSWFCPGGGQILDPFAGGSVRGVVASIMGYKYWGGDLRQEQIAANQIQAGEICESVNMPEWVCGDSVDTLADAPEGDFIFSCPPYGDLEVYSDHPRDLSNMDWHQFEAAYKRIILKSCSRLKDNSFAAFVVGNFRTKTITGGGYRDFVGLTIQGFRDAGLNYYNEIILVTAVGSLGIRVSAQFDKSRKIGSTHQHILVFCKGDPRKATEKIIGNKAEEVSAPAPDVIDDIGF